MSNDFPSFLVYDLFLITLIKTKIHEKIYIRR